MTAALHATKVEVVYGGIPGQDPFSIHDWEIIKPLTVAFLSQHLHPET